MEEEIIKCPYCNGDNYKKNGTREGVQRYYCKNCDKAFSIKNTIKFEPHERAVLSFLLNILENDFYNETDLKSALKPNKNYHKLIRKISFDTRFVDEMGDKLDITCYQPKLLICSDDRDIHFIKIPPAEFRKNAKEDRNRFRRIEIIDSVSNRARRVGDNKNFIYYVKENKDKVKKFYLK